MRVAQVAQPDHRAAALLTRRLLTLLRRRRSRAVPAQLDGKSAAEHERGAFAPRRWRMWFMCFLVSHNARHLLRIMPPTGRAAARGGALAPGALCAHRHRGIPRVHLFGGRRRAGPLRCCHRVRVRHHHAGGNRRGLGVLRGRGLEARGRFVCDPHSSSPSHPAFCTLPQRTTTHPPPHSPMLPHPLTNPSLLPRTTSRTRSAR